jgi:ubiquinone/menaquinone biosynthesis C-methylase UbiE
MPVLLPPLEAYRLWSATWAEDPSPIVALESRWLAPMLTELAGKRFADLSCGAGRWLAFARSRGASVIGTDLCFEMLVRARGFDRALADTRRLPLRDACADVALCALSLGHMAPIEITVSEIARIVAPGGSLLITDFHPGAVVRGWKRTFRSNGQTYEIETHTYTAELLVECAARHGLTLDEMIEPCFDEPERPIFQRAGRLDLFDQARGVPAVLVARWTRR